MAKILVSSSADRDSLEFNKSHPGTTEDDIFIISEASHGFPQVNDDKDLQGGSDIYYLNLDVNPRKKEVHPYGEGGGTPSIQGFNPSTDKIVLPKGVQLKDIVINNYSNYIQLPNSSYQEAEIRYDPHRTLETILEPLGEYKKFSGGLLHGRTLIFTSNETSKLLTGNDFVAERDKDPDGYKLWQVAANERAQLLGQETIAYGADDIGDISFTGSLDEFFHSIQDSKGTSLYEYAFKHSSEENTSDQSSNAITRPSKFKKQTADKITNFNPSTDTLEIDTDSFGIDSSATFATGKNKRFVKKKLAKQDFDFLYDEKKGGLYFNENGSDKGFGDGGIVAILKGAPDLTSGNLEFI